MKKDATDVLASGLVILLGLVAFLAILALKAAIIGGMVYLGYLTFKMLAGG